MCIRDRVELELSSVALDVDLAIAHLILKDRIDIPRSIRIAELGLDAKRAIIDTA